MPLPKPCLYQFESFRREFYWDADNTTIGHNIKCLANVLLSLYFRDYIAADVFQFLHARASENQLWQILSTMPRIAKKSAELGDIVLRDDSAHAMMLIEVEDHDYGGYAYAEYHRDDSKLCWKFRKGRNAYYDEFISIAAIAERISHLPLENIAVTFSKLECVATQAYDGDNAEEEGGFLKCLEGDVVWQLSFVWPSLPRNRFCTGYVWAFNATAMHGRSGIPDPAVHSGWCPVAVIRTDED